MHPGRLCTVILLSIALCACVNLYKRVDSVDGQPMAFYGLRDYMMSAPELHVLQMHGMGDHPSEEYCSDSGENVALQRRIASRLDLTEAKMSASVVPITINGTVAGAYSTKVYVDSVLSPRKVMYFSCLTWGDANRTIKVKMLGLDPRTFLELNENERHRAAINRKAKRFVNRSFSDPIIYVGAFGPFIREAVWAGLQGVSNAQASNRLAIAPRSDGEDVSAAVELVRDVPTIVLSDSLGSRVLFDVLCSRSTTCSAPSNVSEAPAIGTGESDLATESRRSIRQVFLLANQLPLLELASIPPPPTGTTLQEWLTRQPCHTPIANDTAIDKSITLVAMTDQNDALSYHLSDDFKKRCGQGRLKIVNVTVPNARLRYFGVYSSLPKAHSNGFKANASAIDYIVDGTADQGVNGSKFGKN